MKDSFVLYKCALGSSSDLVYSKDVALLYHKYYHYGDLTGMMLDMTGKFSNYPSSQLMEIFKQNALMEYFIDEYFLSDDIYALSDKEENKCRLMIFLIQINNLFRRLYLVDDKKEFVDIFTKIHNVILQFSNEIIPADKILDMDVIPEKYTDVLPKWSLPERFVFQNLAKSIVDYSFNTSLRTKYAILSIIQKNVLNSTWGYVDEERIRSEIEEMILSEM